MKPSVRQAFLCGAAAVFLSAPASASTIFDDIQGVDLSVEGGYLMGSGDLPYAQYHDGVKNYAFKVDPGNGWSGSFAANARFDDGTNVRATYTHTSSSQTAATGSYDGSNTPYPWPVWNILGFLNNRLPNGATSYNSSTVSTDLHADIVDLQAGHDVGLGTEGEFMLLGGLRIADFEQNTSADLFCSRPAGSSGPGGCSTPSLVVSQHRGSRFNGFGPSIGANYNDAVGTQGFGVFGSVLASALLGKQSTSTWAKFGGTSSNSLYADKHIAFTVDARLGLSYTMPDCPVVLAAGYQVSLLDRVRDTANAASATGSDHFGNHQAELLYHGPFLRLTYSAQ